MNKLAKFVFYSTLLFSSCLAGCRNGVEQRISEVESQFAQLENDSLKHFDSLERQGLNTEFKETKRAVIKFENLTHDFGTIREGEKVSFTYKFKNTGEAPLIIERALASCGCTLPEWTTEPVLPGDTGFIKVEFDSSGKLNLQNKSIHVTANTWPKMTILGFTAMVKPSSSDGQNQSMVN